MDLTICIQHRQFVAYNIVSSAGLKGILGSAICYNDIKCTPSTAEGVQGGADQEFNFRLLNLHRDIELFFPAVLRYDTGRSLTVVQRYLP